MKRYALYFAPETDSAWWQAGCQWLGRDAEAMRAVSQPAIDGIDADTQRQLTRDARRYGFHATLKAPFRLAEGCTEQELRLALQSFCSQQAAIDIISPQVQWMGNFLALRAAEHQQSLNDLAFACVRQFDGFRAPLNQDDMARRQRHQLGPRQAALLQQWGYPYVDEEFRFHLTLSDTLDQSLAAQRMHDAAVAYFTLTAPLRIQGIALFAENQAGADFQLLARFAFS
ncbi:DUF1045 domain-containing protein [Undibacterium sp. TJN19]|uniref:DUF1045 domain-containing protein n=1 Tax=Undibacterium sp. TJN19 TaxID=3413055 RepID=UPI003BF2F789